MTKRKTMAAIMVELATEPETAMNLSLQIRQDLLDEHMRLIKIERLAKVVVIENKGISELRTELLNLHAFRFRRGIPEALYYYYDD